MVIKNILKAILSMLIKLNIFIEIEKWKQNEKSEKYIHSLNHILYHFHGVN